ncbi:hypothetical protein AKJ09_04890 [Labilithrix luteola]|uniref:Uncharacterized protein n=1 Tax=Labilithrix luteola TaxID=1391654 RepID=A0A0K1PXY4_9BACT|nr:hypothetical protein AKJ09_04890 [Labilithrix luteola]
MVERRSTSHREARSSQTSRSRSMAGLLGLFRRRWIGLKSAVAGRVEPATEGLRFG